MVFKYHIIVPFALTLIFLVNIPCVAQACPGDAGCLDPTFGIGGMVITSPPLATQGYTQDMVFQGDGKLVMLVNASDAANTFRGALVRFTADGSIDASFADGGFAYIPWTAPATPSVGRLAVQLINGEERLVIAGAAFCSNKPCVRAERYTTSGIRDTTFGTGGVTTVKAGWNTVNAVAIQNDQKILIGGYANPMVRLNANGTADASFGKDGISKTNSGIGIHALEALPNGKFLAAGYISAGTTNNFGIARFNSNGTLDTSFGTGGKTSVDFAGNNDIAVDMAVDATGKILVCGEAVFTGTFPTGYDAELIRLNPNGTLDTTFGVGGKTLPLNIGGAQDEFTSVSVQADGKIVLTGEGRLPGNAADILTARYNSNGTLDTSYDSDGWKLIDIYGNHDSGRKGLIQFDPSCSCEKFVVGASAATGSSAFVSDIVCLRYIL